MALSANQWHILSICIFPCIDILGIGLAIVLSAKSMRLFFSSGVMFSAGVLLASALVHMLPEAQEMFEGLSAGSEEEADHGSTEEDDLSHGGEAYPWSTLLFGIMFLVLLTIEASLDRFVTANFGEEANIFHGDHDEVNGHGHDQPERQDTKEQATQEQAVETSPVSHDLRKDNDLENCAPVDCIQEECHDDTCEGNDPKTAHTHHHYHHGKLIYRRRSTWAVCAKRPTVVHFDAAGSYRDSMSAAAAAAAMSIVKENDDSNKNDTDSVNSDSMITYETGQDVQTINPWVSILLTVVLSIHVIIEGLTINSSSNADQIRSIFIAVVIHKAFSAFSLGSSLMTSGYWTKDLRYMFFILAGIYVSMDIIGLGVGMGLSSAFEEGGLPSAVLMSLLGGSFLFVSTIELIPGELERAKAFKLNLFPIMGSLFLGYALMSLLGKYV